MSTSVSPWQEGNGDARCSRNDGKAWVCEFTATDGSTQCPKHRTAHAAKYRMAGSSIGEAGYYPKRRSGSGGGGGGGGGNTYARNNDDDMADAMDTDVGAGSGAGDAPAVGARVMKQFNDGRGRRRWYEGVVLGVAVCGMPYPITVRFDDGVVETHDLASFCAEFKLVEAAAAETAVAGALETAKAATAGAAGAAAAVEICSPKGREASGAGPSSAGTGSGMAKGGSSKGGGSGGGGDDGGGSGGDGDGDTDANEQDSDATIARVDSYDADSGAMDVDPQSKDAEYIFRSPDEDEIDADEGGTGVGGEVGGHRRQRLLVDIPSGPHPAFDIDDDTDDDDDDWAAPQPRQRQQRQRQGRGGRGLHSFTFRLNLSHYVT